MPIISPVFRNLVIGTFAPVVNGFIIQPPAGNLSFTKFAPNLSSSKLIKPSSGNLSFSLNQPEINGVLVQPPSGNLVISTSSSSSTGEIRKIPKKRELILTTFIPNVTIFVNSFLSDTGILTPRSLIVAVEFDLFFDETYTVRFWSGDKGVNGGLIKLDPNIGLVQFDPRLIIPIDIGLSITADQYGEPLRGIPNSGNIEFIFDEKIWSYFGYHWEGRVFRLYEGNSGDGFSDLELIYTGRIDNLLFDVETSKASVVISNASLDLDKALVEDFYPDTAIESLRGKPKPYLRGEVYSVEPVLEDEASQSYRLSFGKSLTEIMEVRVGGVPWEKVSGTPGDGQWVENLEEGTFILGSSTLGQEVRCDARAGVYSSIDLISEIVKNVGGEIDIEVCKICSTLHPGPIGFYVKEPINIIDVIDVISFGVGSEWEFGLNGEIKIRALAVPDPSLTYRHSPMVELNDNNINGFQLTEIIPPAWRIRVEYKRNWMPFSNILPGVSDADKQLMTSTGIVAEVYENFNTKFDEKRAVDVPLIRTLFVNEEDAISVRDRLIDAWGSEKRLYNVTCWLNKIPELYDTVYVDYMMVRGYFRIVSILRSIGTGYTTLILWGDPNIINSPSHRGYLLNEDGSYILTEDGRKILLEG